MQSDDQKNYWQEGSGPNNESEMYQPKEEPEAEIDRQSGTKRDVKPDEKIVHWSAEEYISQEKNGLWFLVFGLSVLTLIATDLFLIKSYTFSVLVIVMAISIVVFSRRSPRTINYTLSVDQGLYVGEKLYSFNDFKAFGLVEDTGRHSVVLIPIKRFSPSVSVYFPSEFGEQIVDIFGSRLPMEKLKLDAVDVLVRKLRL